MQDRFAVPWRRRATVTAWVMEKLVSRPAEKFVRLEGRKRHHRRILLHVFSSEVACS